VAAVKLYLFQGSCAALTSRLELDYKGLGYDVVYLPPVVHGVILGVRGFPRPSVPALEVDGRRISGTRAISRLLDELQPEPPLFPPDPERRAAVEEAERWGEEFQDAARRLFYCAARRRPSAWAAIMAGGQRTPVGLGLRATAPVLVRFAARYHRGLDRTGRDDVARLPERLDRIDAWIAHGLLDGADLNAADFEIATNVRSLLTFEDLAPTIENRPAATHARRVVPEVPGSFPPVLPRDWLEPHRRVP
jgi:glutathione S-transferase